MRALVFVLAVVFALPPFAAEDKKSVLVIESYHKEYGWDASYLQGIQDVLGRDYAIHRFEMDTKRIQKERWQDQADEAWKLYETLNPAAVIIGDDDALRLLSKKFEATHTPVVFLGINQDPSRYITLGKNITGILERPLIKRSIAAIREIVPECSRILVLFDTSSAARAILEEEFGGNDTMLLQGIWVDLQLLGKRAEWEKIIGETKGHYDAIVLGLYHNVRDENDASVYADTLLAWVSRHTPVPLFGFWDFSVGAGKTAGGLVLYGKAQGIAAARIVRAVLDGADITAIKPKVGEQGRYLFNKKELERFGLSVPPHIDRGAEYN